MDELNFYDGTHSFEQIDAAVDNVQSMMAPGLINGNPIRAIVNNATSVDHYGISGTIQNVPSDTKEIPTLKLLSSSYWELRNTAGSKCVYVKMTNVSSLPVNAAQLPTTHMVMIDENFVLVSWRLSNPSAQLGNWTVTPSTRKVTVDGNINGTTDIELILADPGTIVTN